MFPFKTALNTSTLFPFDLDVKQQVAVAVEAGFEGIELWVKDIQTHLQRGGTIADLRAYIADTGISITDNYLNGGAFTLRNQTGINVDVENNTFANSVWGSVGDLTGYPGTYGSWVGNVDLNKALIAKP